jgi:hypothetical protein
MDVRIITSPSICVDALEKKATESFGDLPFRSLGLRRTAIDRERGFFLSLSPRCVTFTIYNRQTISTAVRAIKDFVDDQLGSHSIMLKYDQEDYTELLNGLGGKNVAIYGEGNAVREVTPI